MANSWKGRWRRIELRSELRSVASTGGTSLHVGYSPVAPDTPDTPASPNPPASARAWLRFDCFDADPHWHVDPAGRNETHPLDERGDPIGEVFGLIVSALPSLLERAGADDSVVADAREAAADAEWTALLREAECAMRHRPAILDELDIRQLEQRRSEKWHTYPRDVLPVWVAEMDFPIAAPIQAELRRFTESADVGYPVGLTDTGLAEVFSEHMHERFGWRPEPSRVEILSEVVQGLYLALLAFAEPGQGAIVQTPIYPPFLHSVQETGRRLVENRLVVRGDRLELDLEGLASCVDAQTRLLLLCNPHNPSGRVFSRTELDRIGEIVLEHDLIVVTDEIHGDLVFDDRKHIPFATLSPDIARRTVTLSSASKAFNIPGLRCAVAHFGSDRLHRRFGGLLPRHVRGGLGLFGIYASIAAWRFGQPWLDEVLPYLQANRDFADQALHERIPEIRFMRPDATYLAWLDCSGLGLERSPAAHFMQHGRVALSDGRLFGAGWEQYARLNFATSRPILTEAIERMAKALGR